MQEYFVGQPFKVEGGWRVNVYRSSDPQGTPVWTSDFTHADRSAAVSQAQTWIGTQSGSWRRR
jgi:hypothetical protein